jgi:ATP synthase F1 delta subunit
MENLTVNSVYGRGLFEAAEELDAIGDISKSIVELKRVFKEYPALFDILRVPTIDAVKRKRIADEIFVGKTPDALLNFLHILMDKRRLGSFFGIARTYEELVEEREGVTSGRLLTATKLAEGRLEKLESETGKLLGKNVRLRSETDPTILGGCRIYIDGKLIDASLKTRLEKLKEKLL